MNVSLTKELERLVAAKVKTGRYLSASEVMREALRLLEERDQLQQLRLDELRREIRKGLDSGPSISGNQVFRELRDRAKLRRQARKKK